MRTLAALLITASFATGQDEAIWYTDLGKHCTVHVGRRGPEIRGKVQATEFHSQDAEFTRAESRITFGPHPGLGVTSKASFTLTCDVRSPAGEFATILMCREGGTVHYSFVMGREPGKIAFEPWNWSRDGARSRRRLDDGEWHRLQGVYDATSRQFALVVDGRVESVVPMTRDFAGSKAPSLRLADNLDPGVKQPFLGAVRKLRMVPGVPEVVREHLAFARATQLLERGAADRSLVAWLQHMRRPRKPQAASADDWRARAERLRARVQDALGLWPPPYSGTRRNGKPSPLAGDADARATDFATYRPQLDLAVKRGGKLSRDGYTLERVYWQTFEDWWASGWLYKPTGQTGKHPAILCPHGHWRNGARHPVVQARCISLAKLGYVVLAADSIHLYEDRIGLTPLSIMTWNNLRGLELLRSLPDVDATRLGVTGASGGGQQTYYLTALDTDLKAAVPAVMTCHFSEILLHTGVHCACNFVAHAMRAADVPQMSAAFAPKPQLFLSVTGDWTKKFPQQGFPPIRAIYERFGAGDEVRSMQWDKGHAYDRPMRNAMYAFFEKALRGRDAPTLDWEREEARTEKLSVLQGLDRDVPRDTRRIVAEFRQRLAADPADADTDPVALRRRFAELLLADEWRAPPAARMRSGKPLTWQDEKIETLWIRAEPTVELPALRLSSTARRKHPGVAVVVGAGGKARALGAQSEWVDRLRGIGFAVLLVDVPYTGELDASRRWRDMYGRIFGRDEGILQVRDLRRVLDALDTVERKDAPRVLVGLGTSGATALLAAIDPRVAAVIAPHVGSTYRESARRPPISRILLHGDLPEAVLAIGDRKVLVGGCTNINAYAGALSRVGVRAQQTPLRPEALGELGDLLEKKHE